MNEWMRNQFMAPVYALVISFVTSLLLGAVLVAVQDRTKPGVTFVAIQGGKEVPVADWGNVVVQIYRTSGAGLNVGTDGSFPLSEASEWPVTVCATLPDGWKANDSQLFFELSNGRTCWKLAESVGEVRLVVVKSRG